MLSYVRACMILCTHARAADIHTHHTHTHIHTHTHTHTHTLTINRSDIHHLWRCGECWTKNYLWESQHYDRDTNQCQHWYTIMYNTYSICTGEIYCSIYHTAGNFQGVQFLQMGDLYHFAISIFTDAHTHTHYALHNRAHFLGLMFSQLGHHLR